MGILVKNYGQTRLFGNEVEKYYLTFEALEEGTFTFYFPEDMESEDVLTEISYSVDNGKSWTTEELESGTEKEVETPTVKKGGTVLWKANGSTADDVDNCRFTSTGSFNVIGNIMSLIYGDEFYGKNFDTERSDSFYYLFDGADIVSAEYMILPNNVVDYCYVGMFAGCTSLTTAPELPATTLQSGCYANMFMGCTSLTTAPELPATTLASNCYETMFKGCSSLNYIKMLATDISAEYCLNKWVEGVAEEGTFEMANNAEWFVRGDSGIPTGWSVNHEEPIIKHYTLYLDKFPPQTVEEDDGGIDYEAEGYTREEYIETEVDYAGTGQEAGWMMDIYEYNGDTLKYYNDTYYVCTGKSGSGNEFFQLLLSTDDFDTLKGDSIEESGTDTQFNSLMYVFTYDEPYDDNTNEPKRQLLKIINNDN